MIASTGTPATFRASLRSMKESGYLKDWGIAVLVIVAIKLAWLVIDHTLRLYMGDSMVFLAASERLLSPGARSWLYAWTLHFTSFQLGAPGPVLVAHVIWSIMSCVGLYGFLRHALKLRQWLCVLAAGLLATEPVQIFMERMVLAETFGLLALVCTLLVLSRYLVTGRLGWYWLGVLGGLAAGAIRPNFIPLTLGMAIVAPAILAAAQIRNGSSRGPVWRHAFISLLVLVLSHAGYTWLYGKSVGQPPGYVAHTGMMRIGLVAPLIKPEHFEGTGVSGRLLDEVERDLDDHWQRGHHIWGSDGLWPKLQQASENPEMVARTITRRAMLDDPLGLIRVNLETMNGYFDDKRVYWRMLDDEGQIAPSAPEIRDIKRKLDWDVQGLARSPSPARTWFSRSTQWLTFCLFALAPLSLLALAAGWNRQTRDQSLLLALTGLGMVAGHLLFAHIVSFRYLHAFPWFVFANLAVILSWITGPGTRSSRHGAGT
ncbi:glycosyltransferase family 39 protein [Marilutibacter chinensis]|nr:glycosyltransferase family 39 protein [Lysobacter chinensis]